VRSRVEIVADVTDTGRPVLVRMRGEGQLAVRATGPGRVHLVGTAAGPLGGDVVEISVQVRAGARLEVHGVAATIALPARTGDESLTCLVLAVADGGHLVCVPPPLVVCRGARVRARTAVVLAGTGGIDLLEQVLLGRHGEPGGDWSARLVADRDGLPLVRTTQTSQLVATALLPPPERPDGRAVRAVVTRLQAGPEAGGTTSGGTTSGGTTSQAGTAGPATHGGAVRCALPGGARLVTALGPDLTAALADADAVAITGGSAGWMDRSLTR